MKVVNIHAHLLDHQRKAPLQFDDSEGLCSGINEMLNQKLRKRYEKI